MTPADQLVELLAGAAEPPLDRGLLLLAAARFGGAAEAMTTVTEGLHALDLLADACDRSDLDHLVQHLFVRQGFAADRRDYHDPRNSFLDVVLDRRRGMPITLSAVLIEVGRRRGLRLRGVGMPGHFLVCDLDQPEQFLDAYHGGVRIGEDGCRARFRAIHGPNGRWDPGHLDPVPNQTMVLRVLNNLTATFRTRDPTQLDWLLDLRLRLPMDPPTRRAVAELCELRGRYRDAARLLDELAAETGAEAPTRRAARLRARLN